MNDKVSSATNLLNSIQRASEAFGAGSSSYGKGINSLEKGALECREMSDILTNVNGTLAEGWANVADTLTKLNSSAEGFIDDLYKAITSYCENVIASENEEAKALDQTKKASDNAIQQIDSLFN